MLFAQTKNSKLALYAVIATVLFSILYSTVHQQIELSPQIEARDPVYSNEVTDITERVEGNKRIVTEHHENARIPFITVYTYPFKDEVTGAAVPPPENVAGQDYYRVISTNADEDSGDEVCAIALNTSCSGYATGATTGFNVCKAFHPTAAEVTDTDGSGAVVYCNGGPQQEPCASLANTCLYCPTCIVGVACNEAIGGLYREMYVSCGASAAVGTDLCSAGLDDDDGSGDGIIDLTASETSFDNTSIIIDGCEVAIDGTHTFTNVTVRRNGRLTQSPTGTGTFNTTDITVTGHTEVAIGSSIDADGTGVAGQNHVDPSVSTTTPQAGARNSYASTVTTDPTDVYGDYFNPIYPGSGGTKANGDGGGVLALTLNTLELEGEISADSANPSLCGGTTGSGGSIKINITGEMTGDGMITANALPCTNASSDGSGGRIAIFYTTAGGINTLDPIQEYTVQAVNESTNDGTPGTIYLEDASQVGVLYNTNEARLIIDESTFSHEKDLNPSSTDDDLNVVLPKDITLYQLEIDDARVTVNASGDTTLSIENLLDIRDGGELTYTDMASFGLINRFIIDATGNTIQVDATSLIDGRGKGALFNEQIDPDSSTTNAVAGFNRSHGGLGDSLEGVDKVYGDFWDPQYPGSGGQTSAFKGGGYIRILADTFTHNGTIRADGAVAGCNGPPGSGGAIKIVTTGIYSGSGTIQADAGDCTNNASASGGGRVAFYYTTLGGINATTPDQTFTITAQNPNPSAGGDGSPGTVYIEDANAVTLGTYATGEGRLMISNPAGQTDHDLGVPLLGTLTLYELTINQGTVTAETVVVEDTLSLSNNAVLQNENMTSLGAIKRLIVNSPNADLTIDATSSIDVQGHGAIFNQQIDPDSSATNAVAGFNRSHGGLGDSLEGVDKVYGDFWDPQYPGSGGQTSAFPGGGYLGLVVDTMDLSGTINASGQDGLCSGPPGSGGGIKITTTGALAGNGIIKADAGDCTNTSSGSGGGRVAFYYTNAGNINTTAPDARYTITAQNPDPSAGGDGSPGTIYIEDSNAVTQGTYLTTQGRLIIANPAGQTDHDIGVPLLGSTNVYELTMNQAVVTANTIVAKNLIDLNNNAVLKHESMVSLGPIENLTINSPAATLSIDATSSIDLLGRGTRGNQHIDPQSSTTNAVSGLNRGHGGVWSNGYATAYGDFRNPIYPGSGGSSSGRYDSGGLGFITVMNLDLEGTISANATSGGGCGAVYGSGGSLNIITTGELTGSGSIQAVGSYCTNNGTQTGGGGRIGFFYDSDPTGAVTNNSPETIYTFDASLNQNYTAPGTIYIEDDNTTNGDPDGQGDLIIDGSSQANIYSTPLFTDETPTSITVTDLTVINGADLIMTSPCTGSLTVTGTIDLSGGGSISDNTAGACTLAASTLNITPSIMDGGVSGIVYSDTVESAGGYAPKTYACLDGLGGSVTTCDNANAGLPNGLTMNAAGVVSGTPTVVGTFNFVVRVTDSDPGGAAIDEQTMQITIGNPPNIPVLKSPSNGGTVNLLSPELKANYSDPDAGDIGTVEFRVSTSSTTDCVNNVNIVASGSSAVSPDNNEDLTWNVTPNLTDLTTYYWCARNNDGVATSNSGAYTAMGEFTVDLTYVPGGSSPQKQEAVEQTPSETEAPSEETPPEENVSDPGAPIEETPTEQPVEPEVPVDQPEDLEPIETPDLPQQEQEEAPGDGDLPPPPQPPTQEESNQVEDLLDEVIDLEQEQSTQRPSEPTPSETGIETTSQSDGRSFTIEVEDQVLEDDLVITGLATTEEDRIEFTGTTSEPNSTITLFFNNNVTVVVTSDENGFWQTFVSAEQLGLTAGERAAVQVEAIASKPGLKSSKVDIGQIELRLTNENEVIAQFETVISENELVTTIQAFSAELVTLIEEQEVVIQTTLTAVAPIVVVSSAPLWGYLPYAPTLIYHFFVYLLGLFGRKKQQDEQLFGQVYDSITKKPLGLAVLRIYNKATNKLVATKVTDKFGRYDLLLEPGEYRIEVKKPQYVFPSKIVTSGPDGDHSIVYNYQTGIVSAEGSLTIPDIPVDPQNAKRSYELANILKKFWLSFQKIGHVLAVPVLFVGSLVSVVTLVARPESLVNWLIVGAYVLLLVLQLRLRTIAEKAWGVVYDLATNAVLPLTTIQLIDPEYGKVVTSRLTDYEGRFAFLPEPGKYLLKANKLGYEQADVVESPGKKFKPVSGEVSVNKEGERVQGDIAMKQR